MLDVPPDLQRYYQDNIERGMPEEHARMLVQEALEDRMSYQHGQAGASWQQGHHPRNGAHNYFWGAHKRNEGTRAVADDFWRYSGMPEPVQGEHAIEMMKHLIIHGFERDAFTIHKDVPFSNSHVKLSRWWRRFITACRTCTPEIWCFLLN